jgi:DNA-directed RNA polymerase subunit omega
MTRISKDKLEEKANSVYRLVLVAAERTKQLAKGSKPLVKTNAKKATTVALEEILEGKVKYENGKTGRDEA